MESFLFFVFIGFIGFFIINLIISAKSSPKGRNSKYIRTQANYTTPRDPYGNFYDPYTGKKHKRKSMDADHIWPHAKGGPNADWNIVYTNKSVNRSKRDKISPEYLYKGYTHNKAMRNNIKKAGFFGLGAGIGEEIAKKIDPDNINLS